MHKTDIVVALANTTDLGVNKADLVVSAFIEQITNAHLINTGIAIGNGYQPIAAGQSLKQPHHIIR